MTRYACLSLFVLICLLAGSCAPIPAPTVQPFADGIHWVLKGELVWVIGETNLRIVVPSGFVMDFASVPPKLQSFVSPVGRHGRAAIVHDFLYWDQRCTRDQADNLMRAAMFESGVDAATAEGIYWAVSAGGAAAWTQNADERAKGWPRVIPGADVLDIPPDADWAGYRQMLFEQGVRPEPRPEGAVDYCTAAQDVARDDGGFWSAIGDVDFLEWGLTALGVGFVLVLLLAPIIHFRYLHLILKALRDIKQSGSR
jgi:hypothetical protein